MNLIPITDDTSQIVRLSLDYQCSISVTFPENLSVECPPSMDLYINGYGSTFGIPLVQESDVLANLRETACIPPDFGAIICLPNKEDIFDRQSLVSGDAAIAYFNMFEVAAMSLV